MLGARVGRLLLLAASAGCVGTPERKVTLGDTPELLSAAVARLTDILVGSVTSPPVASRTYAYASIAAYEALRPAYPEFRTLAGQLHGLQPLPLPPRDAALILPVASVAAFLSVAEALVFAPERVASYRRDVIEQILEKDASRELVTRSVAHGETVAKHILAWAATDGLKQARGMQRFEVLYEPGRWRPTPPAYMDALEPNWQTLRPLVMDSARQFRPPPPLPYDMRENSGFHQQVMTVYQTGTAPTDEQRTIAAFWDCNPFAVKAEGHVMFAVKKISPGGHWMGITAIALRKSGADLMRAAEAYTRVAIALREGFISVWDEKYRSVVVRPETIINETIDASWRPVLQTPPFPEYPSGHSVISAASAEVLTALFGEDFAYDDDVEVPYGLPARSFTSFRSAAQEAAVSRLYGGIHYPMAIENGLVQGRALGAHVVARVETRPGALTSAYR
jgi:membrane-associated phospholipid phosphatase